MRSATIAATHGSAPSCRRTSAVDVHHGHFRYSWERKEQGEVAMEGWSFGWLDEDGRIARIVSFDGLVPGTVRSPQS